MKIFNYNFSFENNLEFTILKFNLHLNCFLKKELKESLYIIYNLKKFYCLDIKQTKNELRKIIFLTELMAFQNGKLLIGGGDNNINSNILGRLNYYNKYCLSAKYDNFPGFVVNDIIKNQGMPSLAFNTNSTKCSFFTRECAINAIPSISFVHHNFPNYDESLKITYKINGNDDTETGALFISFLLKRVLLFHVLN